VIALVAVKNFKRPTGLRIGQKGLQVAGRLRLQIASTITGGVADVQHNVADRFIVKLPKLAGQLQPPGADGPRPFERQAALVAQVGLEQAAALLRLAGDDGLQPDQVVEEAWVLVGGTGRILSIVP
jgi:hypothetical protein